MVAHFVPMWLNGAEVQGTYSFPVHSPETGALLHNAAGASENDALRAAEGCQAAFVAWSTAPASIRRDIFLKVAEVLSTRKEECWHALHDETAAPREFFEITFQQAIDMCKDVAGRTVNISGCSRQSAHVDRHAQVVKVPYGVILGIAPWNAPLVLGLRACIQPLACGNTVVLKGPEMAPKTYWIIASAFAEAGLPPGALNTIYHRPEDASKVTTALIACPLIKKIGFTGSSNVGTVIASTAGQHLKPVLLELGGKAPAIVLQDADLGLAARCCALGAFLHAGQICMSTERIIVHRDVEHEFIRQLTDQVNKVFDTSRHWQPLISKQSHSRNTALIHDALSNGAKLLSEAPYAVKENHLHALRPVILGAIDPKMELYRKESFGPVVTVLIAESDDECIDIGNDTEYGLTAAIFTEDLRRGLRLADRLETGAVHINGMTVHDENSLPHGGVKKSGFGRNNGDEGMNEWLQTKTVTWLK